MVLTPNDIKALTEAFSRHLDERRSVPESEHHGHHEFIELLMEERRIDRERREKLRTQVTGSVIVIFLSGLISALGYAFIQWIGHTKGGGGG